MAFLPLCIKNRRPATGRRDRPDTKRFAHFEFSLFVSQVTKKNKNETAERFPCENAPRFHLICSGPSDLPVKCCGPLSNSALHHIPNLLAGDIPRVAKLFLIVVPYSAQLRTLSDLMQDARHVHNLFFVTSVPDSLMQSFRKHSLVEGLCSSQYVLRCRPTALERRKAIRFAYLKVLHRKSTEIVFEINKGIHESQP